jgi:hypothetical protein
MEPDSWDQAEELAKQHEESGGLWLKLVNDKDRAVVVFLGAPFARDVCFIDGKYVLFDEALKAKGERPTARVAFNVALYDTKDVKIFEQGLTFYKDLKRVRDKYGVRNWAFEVQRHGAAKDPKTTYSILPDRQLTAEEQSVFQALVLHDLPAVYAGDAADAEAVGSDGLDSYDRSPGRAAPSQPKAATAAPAVIDDRTVELLVTHLKPLPRAAVERFCAMFGIARIKELPATRAAEATRAVDALVAEYNPPAKAATPPDPFE